MDYKNLEVSYEDIVAFYKEKGQNSSSFPITQRFLENNKPTENEEYIKLARVMTCKDYEDCLKKITKIKQNENYVFKAIFELKLYWNLLPTMQCFNGFKQEEIDTICEYIENQNVEKFNPKWHLYVSYMAFQELDSEYHFWGKSKVKCFSQTIFNYYLNCKCPSLILWMAEVSDAFDPEKINEASISATKVINEGGKSKKAIGDACNEIRKILSWEILKKKIVESK